MSLRSLGKTLVSNSQLAVTTNVSQVLDGVDNYAIQAVYSDGNPGAKVFASANVNTGNSTLGLTNHGLATGLVGQFTTSGSLPTGISAATNYYVIVVDANTISIATSLANAVAGTKVTISTQGTGNQTFTPTTSAGNVLKLQCGNDGANWADVSGDTVTIATTSGNVVWNVIAPGYRYVNVSYVPSAGAANLVVTINGVLTGAR